MRLKLLKTIGTVALVSALFVSNVPQAWASEAVPASGVTLPAPGKPVQADPSEAKITKDQAVELAKKYIEIPADYTLQSVNLNSYNYYGSGGPSWSLSFTKQVGDRQYGNIHITINGMTGRLTNYSSYNNDPDYKPSYPPKVDLQGAKEAAAKWIAKLNPEEHAKLTYNDSQEDSFKVPLNGAYQYNIRYDRTENGVAFPQNGVSVNVDGDGIVTSYNFQWDDKIAFEKATPISSEEAAKAFREKAQLNLTYQIPYEAAGDKKPIIAYNMNIFQLNATNGELWDQAGMRPSTPNGKPLTDSPLGAKPAANLNLTKEQAIEKVTSTFKLPVGAKLEDASYSEYTNPQTGEVQSSWHLRWNEPSSDEDKKKGLAPMNVWATVNSKTGEINNFNRYMPIPFEEQNKKIEAKVTIDEAKTKAIEFVKKHFPAYTHQLVLDTSYLEQLPAEQLDTMRNYDLNFRRMIDGVYANHESIFVGIDKTTGDITNFSYNISNMAYPEQKPEVLSEDKALELLLSPYKIELQYILPQQYSGNIPVEKLRVMMAAGEIPPSSVGTDGQASKAKLAYVLTSKYQGEPYFLDAVTGQWKNIRNGEIITLEKVKVTDIDGHWAQNELQIMLDYKALDVANEKVNPDAAITRGELIKMLVIAMNGGHYGIYYSAERTASFADVKNSSPYFAYVENAVDRGLIDRGKEFNPEAKMSREDMAELIVRALGYNNLTKYDGIFNDQFADSDLLKNRGDVAVVTGLGIMTLSEGSFHPKQEVTRAQAATAFFRYLQKRAELQPSRGGYYY